MMSPGDSGHTEGTNGKHGPITSVRDDKTISEHENRPI